MSSYSSLKLISAITSSTSSNYIVTCDFFIVKQNSKIRKQFKYLATIVYATQGGVKLMKL